LQPAEYMPENLTMYFAWLWGAILAKVVFPQYQHVTKADYDEIGPSIEQDCSLPACSQGVDHPITGFVETTRIRDGIPIGNQVPLFYTLITVFIMLCFLFLNFF